MFVSGVVVKKGIDVEGIIQYILSQCPDLTREEIVLAMEKNKVASGRFLTEVATARLVAAEYGVEIKFERPLPKIYIHQLVSGLNDVSVSGRVLLVNKPQVFSRIDRNGQVAQLLIADKTGFIKVVLWNEKAKLTKKIQLGQIVRVFHGYVRRSKDEGIELHIGHRGDIQIDPPDIREGDFPSIKDFCQRIASIKV